MSMFILARKASQVKSITRSVNDFVQLFVVQQRVKSKEVVEKRICLSEAFLSIQ